jgi:hypothetical protein
MHLSTRNFILFFGFAVFLFKTASAQEIIGNGRTVSAVVIDGDTIPRAFLPSFYIVERRTFKSKADERAYLRLKQNVVKVYPYARFAGEKLREYEEELMGITDEKEKKKFYKRVEKELRAEFEGELMDLTITQGRILIKLIDRETGNTSYELVEALRGTFTAFFFQSFARLFGHNLKSNYDPKGEDKLIEDIVVMIESNNLQEVNKLRQRYK